MILGLCERFHCLPSQIIEEEADILQLLAIEQKGNPEPTQPEDDGGDYEDYY